MDYSVEVLGVFVWSFLLAFGFFSGAGVAVYAIASISGWIDNERAVGLERHT